MDDWQNVVNLEKPLAAGELVDRLSDIYNFAGIITIQDIDKIRINEFPLSFIIFYNNHWTAIFVNLNQLEIMDSIHSTFESPCPEFINFLYQHKDKKILINPMLQSANSNVCGLYCIQFIIEKSKKKSYQKILKNFTTSVILNDYIIKKLIKRNNKKIIKSKLII